MSAMNAQQTAIVTERLQVMLALLRAQYMLYQTSHWQSSGQAYYGNHLLFQRLYEGVQAEVDGLAEKLVGYVGAGSVDLTPQVALVMSWVQRWTQVDDLHMRGLQSERDLQAVFQSSYDAIKAARAMTLGLDDFIMATASAHDTNAYLLQQVLQAPAGRVAALVRKRFAAPSDSGAPSAEGAFRNMNPKFHETRQFAETGAITNSKTVAQKAAPILDISKSEAKSGVEQTPPTTKEILQEPGGKTLSTLNRALYDTVDPKVERDTGKRVKGASLAGWTYLTPEGGWTLARRSDP
jgi:DNA-binding ferritin-like protein